jgi:hypothetical protein
MFGVAFGEFVSRLVPALGGGVSFLAGALLSDPSNAGIALVFVVLGYPLYRVISAAAMLFRYSQPTERT